eukprot:gene11371-13441_t
MAATRRLLEISFRPHEDPSPQIAAFNAELRESSRKTRWDESEVKDLFLDALDKTYYLPVLNEFIGYDKRAGVDLLTIQQRVMAVFAAKGKSPSPSISAGYAGEPSALVDQMASVLDALEDVRKELRQLKSGHGFTPRGEKRAYDARDAAGFHALCLLHGEPPVEEAYAFSFTPTAEEIFDNYDNASPPAADTCGMHADSFVPGTARASEHAASGHGGLALHPGSTTTPFMDRFCGAPLAAAAFAPTDTAHDGTAPQDAILPAAVFLSAAEPGKNADLHPDSDSDFGEEPAVHLDADGDPMDRPRVSFGGCRIGAVPRTALLATAVLCTILASASAAHAAAVPPAGYPTTPQAFGFVPDTFSCHPSTTLCFELLVLDWFLDWFWTGSSFFDNNNAL